MNATDLRLRWYETKWLRLAVPGFRTVMRECWAYMQSTTSYDQRMAAIQTLNNLLDTACECVEEIEL